MAAAAKLPQQSDVSSKKNSLANDQSKFSISLPKMSATVEAVVETSGESEPKVSSKFISLK